MPLAEKRYAQALIDISAGSGTVEAVRKDLDGIAEAMDKHQDLRLFLLNPATGIDAKKDAVRSIFAGKIGSTALNFLLLLLDKGRFKCLPGIVKEYARLADRKNNILNIAVISAVPVDEEAAGLIVREYGRMYDASSVKADFQVDKSLIGGIMVKIGDKIFDGTVKGRLESLKEALLNG